MPYSNAARRRDRATGSYPREWCPTSLDDFYDEVTIDDNESALETTYVVRNGHTVAYATRSAIDFDAPIVVEIEQWSIDETQIIGSARSSYVPAVAEPWTNDMSLDDRFDYIDVDPDPFAQAIIALWPVLVAEAKAQELEVAA